MQEECLDINKAQIHLGAPSLFLSYVVLNGSIRFVLVVILGARTAASNRQKGVRV